MARSRLHHLFLRHANLIGNHEKVKRELLRLRRGQRLHDRCDNLAVAILRVDANVNKPTGLSDAKNGVTRNSVENTPSVSIERVASNGFGRGDSLGRALLAVCVTVGSLRVVSAYANSLRVCAWMSSAVVILPGKQIARFGFFSSLDVPHIALAGG